MMLPARREGGARATPFCGGEFLKSENPQSETRPHSSPDPSCGRDGSRGRANPYPPSQMFRPAESALVFRVLRKMGSDFFKQTPPFQICRRSCLGASPLGIGFRQEIPGGFEIRQKHSRRKSAVPKQSLDCAKGARADEERFLEIVGVSAMPLSI